MPRDPVDIAQTRGGRPAAAIRRRAPAATRPQATPRAGRPTPSAGQLFRVGLLLSVVALCAGALKAGLGRTVAGTERTASPQTSGGTVKA